MSLNGLEAVEVSEAFQSALSEGGGWFLLKYNARDEVALLQRGKGGVAEVQEAVHGYEEQSPLYGFIHYRRRKVVLKYAPEGTSRLLLARLAVHFEFIKERFAPYDTIFTFAEAYELSDSTLSSTCSLHTAASIKSLRDSPSRNLAGVKEEDGSESGTVRSPGSEAGTIRNSKIGADIAEESRRSGESSPPQADGDSQPQPKANGTSDPDTTPGRTSSITRQTLRPRTASNTDKDLPPTPKFASPYTSEKPGSVYDQADFTYRSSIDTRISSNSTRPTTRELNKAYDYNRPKIKVGPRPSMDSAMRPDAANGGEQAVRPVASLPSGVRLPSRKGVPPRPNSQQSQKKFSLQIPKLPSQGSTPAPPPVTPVNATTPLEKIPPLPSNSLQPNQAKAADPKSPKMTPEKRRLMKALEIRKKQLAAQQATKAPADDELQENQHEARTEEAAPVDDALQENRDEVKTEEVTIMIDVPKPSSEKAVSESVSQQPELGKSEEEVPQAEDREAGKGISHEVQDSPISAPEPSDGPSTQASSITEEEIPPTQRQDEPEANIPANSYKESPGLQEILRDQTQGPIVTVEEVTAESGEKIMEPAAIAGAQKEHVEERGLEANVEQESSAEHTSLREEPSKLRVEGDAARDSAKTTSIVSEASSVRTVTDKQIAPPAEPTSPPEGPPLESASPPEDPPVEPTRLPEDPPAASPPKASPHVVVETPEPSKSISQTSSGDQKEEFDESVAPVDIEEPESPLLIEGHSVQTSASPSVVNLLDGLAATTHNESILPSQTIETIAPIQAQQPSLFNIVGGLGDGEESIETPLSAVREEAELVPSTGQPDSEKLPNEPPQQQAKSPEPSSDSELAQSRRSRELVNSGNHSQSTEKAESSAVNWKSQMEENIAAISLMDQKTRPRAISKTFHFPSKSRSLNRGEKPTSLDLPRDGTHSRRSLDRHSSEISNNLAINSRRNTMLSIQKVEFAVQPDAQSSSQQPPQHTQPPISKPEKQVDRPSSGPPVPNAISHASSKALRLLGFDASRPEVVPDVRSETASKRNSSVPQEASNGVERVARSEVLPAPKLDGEAHAEGQPKYPAKGDLEGSSDTRSEVQDKSQAKPSTNESLSSNTTKAVDEESRTDIQAKRRGVVEPVKRVSTPEPSEEHFLSDDSFMEELKSAKLQEAKPVSVSRSSIRPDYLRSETDPKYREKEGSQMGSNPLGIVSSDAYNGPTSRPATAVSLRSFSGTILPKPDVKTSPSPPSAQPKKFGVSSGISQRIKALETKSSRPTSPILPAPTSPGFLNLRKSSFNSERSYDFRRSRASTAYPSPQTSPQIGGSESLNQPYQHRGETVSVTATIVRDPNDKSPRAPRKSTNPPPLNLHESPLVVEHQVANLPKQQQQQQVMGPPQFSPLKPPRPRYSRYSSTKSVSSSSTEPKADAAPHSRRGSVASMRSGMSSRDGSETDLQRGMCDKSPSTSAPLDNIKEEKRMSRSSRLLKRMSSVTNLSRRSIAQAISPSPKTASIMEREEAIEEKPNFSTIDIGDVNVQFPDTLLWKRRHLTITEGGVLRLAASKSDHNPRIVTKQYPLSDFRPPYLPDQDRQELPNSILLDFHDGSSLQCACEHPSAQAHLLKILKTAHTERQVQ